MNKIVASISLGTAVCITASAFAQDSHLSLTRQSVASMHEIAAALDKVTDEPGAAAAVETVKKVHKKLLDIGKRQLELPGATLQEQAQVSAQMTEAVCLGSADKGRAGSKADHQRFVKPGQV